MRPVWEKKSRRCLERQARPGLGRHHGGLPTGRDAAPENAATSPSGIAVWSRPNDVLAHRGFLPRRHGGQRGKPSRSQPRLEQDAARRGAARDWRRPSPTRAAMFVHQGPARMQYGRAVPPTTPPAPPAIAHRPYSWDCARRASSQAALDDPKKFSMKSISTRRLCGMPPARAAARRKRAAYAPSRRGSSRARIRSRHGLERIGGFLSSQAHRNWTRSMRLGHMGRSRCAACA